MPEGDVSLLAYFCAILSKSGNYPLLIRTFVILKRVNWELKGYNSQFTQKLLEKVEITHHQTEFLHQYQFQFQIFSSSNVHLHVLQLSHLNLFRVEKVVSFYRRDTWHR